MEESLSFSMINSRKRKKNGPSPSISDPLMGILTRNKSRMPIHRNTSGIRRSNSIPSKSIPDRKSLEAFLDLDSTDASRLSSIKDLRTKRVFTPDVNSVPQEEKDEEDEKKIEERAKLLKSSDATRVVVPDVKVEHLGNSAKDRRNDMENILNSKDRASISRNRSLSSSKMVLNRCCREKVFNATSSFSYRRLLPYLMDIVNKDSRVSKIKIVDGVNCKVRSTAENRAAKIECDKPQFDSKPLENQDIEKVQIQTDHENHMNGDDDASVEEHFQTTPPDSGIFTNKEFGHARESVEAKKELAENQTFRGLSVDVVKSNHGALRQSPNSKCITDSMNSLFLNPCSRLRVFKNPRSVSYKRLLPFLMDISKNNSGASRNTQSPIPLVVLEEDISVNGTETNETEKPNEKQHTDDFTQDSASSTVSLPLSDGSSADSKDILVSTSANCSSNLDLQTEELPQIQASPTKSGEGHELEGNTSPSAADSDILTKQCTSEEQNICLDTRLELCNSNMESIKKVNLEQNSSKGKASSDVLCPGERCPKGILKRNRIGCRGLCNCLNCTSFRLHADRAFEFSRNQMCDAEEVASQLMNELADLRLLLEKSIIQNIDSTGSQLDPVLVKQACNKALEAEKIAKESLIELNNDLNVHCRIPVLLQRKVTFASNIQERAI